MTVAELRDLLQKLPQDAPISMLTPQERLYDAHTIDAVEYWPIVKRAFLIAPRRQNAATKRPRARNKSELTRQRGTKAT